MRRSVQERLKHLGIARARWLALDGEAQVTGSPSLRTIEAVDAELRALGLAETRLVPCRAPLKTALGESFVDILDRRTWLTDAGIVEAVKIFSEVTISGPLSQLEKSKANVKPIK